MTDWHSDTTYDLGGELNYTKRKIISLTGFAWLWAKLTGKPTQRTEEVEPQVWRAIAQSETKRVFVEMDAKYAHQMREMLNDFDTSYQIDLISDDRVSFSIEYEALPPTKQSEEPEVTDQEHASAIETATNALNKAIGDAANGGLRIEVDTIEHQDIRHHHATPILRVTTLRNVKSAA